MSNFLTTPRKLLLSRFLTRSGDQAWDFAVPIVLLEIFPGQLQIAALYYFLIRFSHVVFFPPIAARIDRIEREEAVIFGIALQVLGVVFGVASIYFLQGAGVPALNLHWVGTFAALVLFGFMSQVGSAFMDISVANDIVPTVLEPAALSTFNSRLRQLDLFTEVASPVLAGLLLLWRDSNTMLWGFWAIGVWNVASFFPEYQLLKSVLDRSPQVRLSVNQKVSPARVNVLTNFFSGWKSFFKEPVAGSVLAYAVLWLSVLSPHGVILTGFLKDGWQMPEVYIGLFRGAGAVFGLVATLIFPLLVARLGLIKTTLVSIIFQSLCVTLALLFFIMGTKANMAAQFGFLAMVLLSRIGLYSFSLGEVQIRQIGIPPQMRGRVNGFASSLTAIATLILYGSGALLPKTDDFASLITLSFVSVAVGAMIFGVWAGRTKVLDLKAQLVN